MPVLLRIALAKNALLLLLGFNPIFAVGLASHSIRALDNWLDFGIIKKDRCISLSANLHLGFGV